MKVLHVINNLDFGGAQTLVRDLAARQLRRGVRAEVCLLAATGSPLEGESRDLGLSLSASGSFSLYAPRQVSPLARRLAEADADLVHVHLYPAQLWAPLAARRARLAAPLVTTEHSTHNQRRRHLFRLHDRLMYRSYRAIACISEAVADALVRWQPGVRDRVRVVPNGVDLDRFRDARPAEALAGAGRPLLLSVGWLNAPKDHATTLRALRAVPGAHLVVAGEGPRRHELERLAADLGIAGRVRFLGARPDVPRLLKAADVFVQSSLWEGFGLAALEAMAAGCPVVATRVPGLAGVVGDAGVLFEPGDADGLAKILNALLADPARRTALAERGRSRAAAFTIDRMADAYDALYREILLGDREGERTR